MNKTILKFLVGIIALSLAICAAFFSIVGLSKLFAGAAVAVIIMASTLEASKLVIASFLHQYWYNVKKTLKFYLLIAISIITMITSVGIYGFLSGAYHNTKSKFDLVQTKADSLNAKQVYFKSSVATYQQQLTAKNTQLNNLNLIRNSQEQRANELVTSNRSSNSADKSAKRTDANIARLNSEIDILNRKILSLNDSISKISVIVSQIQLKNEISSELGSLSYVSKILNVPMDKVVNVLILMFIIVFDPLAICLVLVFNYLNKPVLNVSSITNDSEELVVNAIEYSTDLGSKPPVETSLTDIEYNITNEEKDNSTAQDSVENEQGKRSAEKNIRLQDSIARAVSSNATPTYIDDNNVKFY
jgi:hypothetical protein